MKMAAGKTRNRRGGPVWPPSLPRRGAPTNCEGIRIFIGDTEDRVSTGGHDDRISRDLLRKRRRLFRKQRRAQNA